MTRILELAGPPGSGKTTLAPELARVLDAELLNRGMHVRNLRSYFGAAFDVAPVAARVRRPARMSPRFFKWMVRSEALRKLSDRRDGGRHNLLFDQGPVYTLARLRGAGRDAGDPFRRWWWEQLEGWASVIDIVVLLDAPVQVLLGRMHERPKQHEIAKLSESEAAEAIVSSRVVYRELEGLLSGRTRVLTFNTSTTSMTSMISRVAKEVGRVHSPIA